MAKRPLSLIPASELGSLPPTERLGTSKFVAGGLNVVYGPSGCYKSFYVLDTSLRIAQTRPIIYIAGEGVGGLHNRVEAWCEHNKCGPGESYFVDHAINLLDTSEVNAFCQVAWSVKPVLIVFDTLARCIPGADENSAKDMGLAVKNNDLIRQRLNATSGWVHHANRKESGERGSGAIRGAADNMIEIYPNGDGSVRLSCSKSKDEEHWLDEQYTFLPVLRSGVLVPTIGYATLKYSDQEIRILEFLRLPAFEGPGAKVSQIMNSLGIPERTIYRMISHLKVDCQITQGKHGDPYHITEDGLATLRQYIAIPTDTTEIEVEQ